MLRGCCTLPHLPRTPPPGGPDQAWVATSVWSSGWVTCRAAERQRGVRGAGSVFSYLPSLWHLLMSGSPLG